MLSGNSSKPFACARLHERMYIATFYSFKGGVGRTMALVNVAVSLALRGRRVLAVDFDVEAPGLDTFDVLRPQKEVPGVIDFVTQYLDSGMAPDASGFIGRCAPIGKQGGELWIMPSGKADTYSANFKELDWGELYERHDGYLLFEDLKEQWKRVVAADYVLIDSRTGHTDTSGICTRQLSDSVVVFFFPNEQNLRGLAEVVSDIRAEKEEPRNKAIDLHFVMSNVPDLDDEDQILESNIKAFQDQLGFVREPLLVHRYDSLSLLNQVVFAKDRPRSRLAKEYRNIIREISARNPSDRDGALEYIRRSSRQRQSTRGDSALARERMLERIEKAHPEDSEVLWSLSELRKADGEQEMAEALILRAIDAGHGQPKAYLHRSNLRIARGDMNGAREDIWRVLNGGRQNTPASVGIAIQQLADLGACDPAKIAESAAVQSLDLEDRLWLVNAVNTTPAEIPIAVALCENILRTAELSASMREQARHCLAMSYMACAGVDEAARIFREESQCLDDLSIGDAFNYGMAKWGEDGTVDADPFRRVVELDRPDTQEDTDPNYLQCMALAYWACGENTEALNYLDSAAHALEARRGRREFSCWRYLRASAESFAEDLDEIRDLINGGKRIPKFRAAAGGIT